MTSAQAERLGLTKAQHAKMQPLEEDEQAIVVQWLEANGVRFFAVPNGQKRTKYEQRIAKKLGMQPGVPDLWITDRPPCAGEDCIGAALERYHPETHGPHRVEHCKARPCGLVIEMKRSRPAKSEVSEEQEAWISHLYSQGWVTRVCYGADEAISLLMKLGYARRTP